MTREEFKQLFEAHFDSIRSYIYYRCGDQDLATDVAQDAFMRVWEKGFEYEDKKTLGLVYKIASDLFISRYRHQKVEREHGAQLSFDYEEASPEAEMEFSETRRKYEQALADLPEKQREVFLMSRVEELKYQEIADRLSISVKAVEKRMHQALDHFKKVFSYGSKFTQ